MSKGRSTLEYLVSEALLTSDSIHQAVFEIEDVGGVIKLKGAVGFEQDRLIAEALARQQKGVMDVINNLWVPSFLTEQVAGGDNLNAERR